jgi:hypothetical protein
MEINFISRVHDDALTGDVSLISLAMIASNAFPRVLRRAIGPGIFQDTTPGVTTKEDKDMVLDCMRNPRSIMLTVVPANVDIATQRDY